MSLTSGSLKFAISQVLLFTLLITIFSLDRNSSDHKLYGLIENFIASQRNMDEDYQLNISFYKNDTLLEVWVDNNRTEPNYLFNIYNSTSNSYRLVDWGHIRSQSYIETFSELFNFFNAPGSLQSTISFDHSVGSTLIENRLCVIELGHNEGIDYSLRDFEQTTITLKCLTDNGNEYYYMGLSYSIERGLRFPMEAEVFRLPEGIDLADHNGLPNDLIRVEPIEDNSFLGLMYSEIVSLRNRLREGELIVFEESAQEVIDEVENLTDVFNN